MVLYQENSAGDSYSIDKELDAVECHLCATQRERLNIQACYVAKLDSRMATLLTLRLAFMDVQLFRF